MASTKRGAPHSLAIPARASRVGQALLSGPIRRSPPDGSTVPSPSPIRSGTPVVALREPRRDDPVTGIAVTLEPDDGDTAPSETMVLYGDEVMLVL